MSSTLSELERSEPNVIDDPSTCTLWLSISSVFQPSKWSALARRYRHELVLRQAVLRLRRHIHASRSSAQPSSLIADRHAYRWSLTKIGMYSMGVMRWSRWDRLSTAIAPWAPYPPHLWSHRSLKSEKTLALVRAVEEMISWQHPTRGVVGGTQMPESSCPNPYGTRDQTWFATR